MNTPNGRARAPRSLEALGIDDMEECVYRALLAHRKATAEDVANLLSLTPRKARRLLDSIEAKGLANHSPERPRQYIAAPPEFAVEALIAQRQAVLERTRSTIPELKEQAANAVDSHLSEQMELVSNSAALSQILAQLLQTVQTEIVAFQRAPVLYIHGHQEAVPAKVRIRTISDKGYLALPGALKSLRLDMENGEEVRIFPDLPLKMFVVDRRVALVLMNSESGTGPILLVRASSLLDALCALFELTWEQSTPIEFTRTGKLNTGKLDARLSDAAEQIIPLLAAGLNDKAILHETGMSAMTLTRRITELMKAFDTRTRFQLGWRAALDAFPNGLAASSRAKKGRAPR